MKYLILEDVDSACLKKGMVIDENEEIYMTIKLDKEFYEANPHAFRPVKEENDV